MDQADLASCPAAPPAIHRQSSGVRTDETYARKNPKRIYYVSIEFLIGRRQVGSKRKACSEGRSNGEHTTT
jgi:hypothetical protein